MRFWLGSLWNQGYKVSRELPRFHTGASLAKAPDKRRQWLRLRLRLSLHVPKRRKPDPFAVVRGKVVERIEVSTMDDDGAIGILFKDRTYLGFDVEPFLRITPDYSDWNSQLQTHQTLATSPYRIIIFPTPNRNPLKGGFSIVAAKRIAPHIVQDSRNAINS
jgi:hypothetical protein